MASTCLHPIINLLLSGIRIAGFGSRSLGVVRLLIMKAVSGFFLVVAVA